MAISNKNPNPQVLHIHWEAQLVAVSIFLSMFTVTSMLYLNLIELKGNLFLKERQFSSGTRAGFVFIKRTDF